MEVIPEDIVRQCLLRMPYTSHDTMRAVWKSWEAILSSPTFYADRQKCGTSQQLICLIQRNMDEGDMNALFVVRVYDPLKGTWERLPAIDDPQISGIPVWCQCVAVNRKLVVIFGIHPSTASLKNRVYIYDFESARWRRGADMPTPRSFFACSASSSNGLVYVAGGIGERPMIRLATAEAYNVDKDKWEILAPMIQPRGGGCRGVFVEGEFMVFQEGERAQVFDPNEGTWRIKNFRGGVWRSCVIYSSLERGWYRFTARQQVEKCDVEKHVWSVVASPPNTHDITHFTCATQWRDQFFISGSGDRRRSNTEKHISYLFNLSTREFTKINGHGGEGFAGKIVSAAIVEI